MKKILLWENFKWQKNKEKTFLSIYLINNFYLNVLLENNNVLEVNLSFGYPRENNIFYPTKNNRLLLNIELFAFLFDNCNKIFNEKVLLALIGEQLFYLNHECSNKEIKIDDSFIAKVLNLKLRLMGLKIKEKQIKIDFIEQLEKILKKEKINIGTLHIGDQEKKELLMVYLVVSKNFNKISKNDLNLIDDLDIKTLIEHGKTNLAAKIFNHLEKNNLLTEKIKNNLDVFFKNNLKEKTIFEKELIKINLKNSKSVEDKGYLKI